MEIDADRLRTDIEANAEFGGLDVDAGHGRTVYCGTQSNRLARERLVDRLESAGCDVRIDAVGNIAGRWTPSSADPDASPVAAGSHLDSVPSGGIFDGPLGVYGALEAVRAMQDAEVEPTHPIEVVSFTEEEGQRFASGLLGSSVAAGVRDVGDAMALVDGEGVTLEEALRSIGFRGEGRLDAANWEAWMELHIEQADRLEAAGVPVGIVTSIAGITHSAVSLRGDANHAGTTPMHRRLDALAAAAEFVLDVESAAQEEVDEGNETVVATVGRLEVEPNATNVVPGRVEMGVDVRDGSTGGIEAVLARAVNSLDRLAGERDVEVSIERRLDVPPTPLSERVQAAARSAATKADIETMALHSGAAHDSMHVASVTDAGMLSPRLGTASPTHPGSGRIGAIVRGRPGCWQVHWPIWPAEADPRSRLSQGWGRLIRRL